MANAAWSREFRLLACNRMHQMRTLAVLSHTGVSALSTRHFRRLNLMPRNQKTVGEFRSFDHAPSTDHIVKPPQAAFANA